MYGAENCGGAPGSNTSARRLLALTLVKPLKPPRSPTALSLRLASARKQRGCEYPNQMRRAQDRCFQLFFSRLHLRQALWFFSVRSGL